MNTPELHYVYLIRSIAIPEDTYVGYTTDISNRLNVHNTGGSFHTAKSKPWQLITYCCFSSKEKALDFERYLKTHSGRAFSSKRLW
jgi:putative endonuclease